MAKGGYLGISSKAKKIKKIYIGVGGKAKKVKKAYIGVGGKAKLFYSSSLDTNKMMVIANKGNTGKASVYELNTDTGVYTIKSDGEYDYNQLLYEYGRVDSQYDNVNNRFITGNNMASNNFGITWAKDNSLEYFYYKGHYLGAACNSSGTYYGCQAIIDGTYVYLGQYIYTSGADATFKGIIPYSDTEVIYSFVERWYYPNSHQNQETRLYLVNIETHEVTGIRTLTGSTYPYEFGYFPHIHIMPGTVDLAKKQFVIKYRDTDNDDYESQFHVGLVSLVNMNGYTALKKVSDTTPTPANMGEYSWKDEKLGGGAKTEDKVIVIGPYSSTNYYLSLNNGKTWTLTTAPNITQGNKIAKVYATGENFFCILCQQGWDSYGYNYLYLNTILKSNNGSTWTIVGDIPNRSQGTYDKYVVCILPILIGTYYNDQT